MAPANWSALSHAYGEASNIPGLLRDAAEAPAPKQYTDEPWFTLWSSLCHQDDVYSASFAALPSLLEIARSRRGRIARECLHLAAWIEVCRHKKRAPEIPIELKEQYENSLRDGIEVAKALLASENDSLDARAFRGAIEAFSGRIDEARVILDPD